MTSSRQPLEQDPASLAGIKRLSDRLGGRVAAHPVATILLGLLVTAVFASGLTQLTVSADYRIFFAETDPRLVELNAVEATFGKTDTVVVVVKPNTGDVFTPDAVAAVQTLTRRLGTLPHIERVRSLTRHVHARTVDEDLLIEPLLPEGEATAAELQLARELALDEPLLTGALVAADGGATGVVATLNLPTDDPLAVAVSAEAARAIVAEVGAAHPNLDLRLSGLAILNDTLMRTAVDDILWTIPLMTGLMVLGLWGLLRSGVATAGIFTVVSCSSLAAIGTAGWLGYPLSPVSASTPTILITLCVADGVHLFLTMRTAMAEGQEAAVAVRTALRHTLKPIGLTSVSTIVGFACLNFAEAPPFAHMANTTVVGIAVAFGLSVTMLPALLVLWPPAPRPAWALPVAGLDPWAWFARHVLRWRRATLALGAVLAVVAVGLASTLERNDPFVEYFDASVPFRVDTEFMMEHLAGLYLVDFQVPADGANGVTDPAYLRTVDAFTLWLRDQPEVTHASSLADLVKRLNVGFADGAYAVPTDRNVAAQEILAYELSLPPGQQLTDRIDLDKASSKVSVVVGDLSSREMKGFSGRAEGWLVDNAPPHMAARAVSPVVLFSHLSDDNTRAMVKGNVLSLLLISAGMGLALWSWRLGLLSLIPNLLPIALAYGAWAVLHDDINVVASIAVAVCLGLIVDDTIHFLSRYQDLRRRLPVEEALTETLRTVGSALVLTSIVLGLGFCVLAQSPFSINRVFGTLVLLVVVFGLVADLLLLPACLAVFDGDPKTSTSRVTSRRASMAARRSVLSLAAAVVGASVLSSSALADDGSTIAQRLAAEGAGWGDMLADIEMVLDTGKKSATRQLRLKMLERPAPDEGDWSLLVFDSPNDVAGTALLSHAAVNGADSQWLFLPALKTARRIGGASQSGAFVGSEFTYEDIAGLNVDKHTWTVLGRAPCGSATCVQVQTRPRDAGDSAYSRRVLTLEEGERLLPQSIAFFDRDDQPLKTLTYGNYVQVDGHTRATSWTMHNQQTGRSTTLTFKNMDFGTGLTESAMSKASLSRIQ